VVTGEPGPDRATSSRAALLGDFELDEADLLPPGLASGLSRHAKLTLRVGVDAWRAVRSRVDPERASVILANILLPTDGAAGVAAHVLLPSSGSAPPLSPLDAFPASLPAGLLSRALGLGGGSFTLDAACASSLYAIHLACAELEAERVDAVLSGGVSLPQSIYTQVGFSQLQALSPTGRCLPYDEAANGLVVGEGAAMVVLKRLTDAVRDGDAVLGVIRAVGLSNDVGGSLLSPESEGQLRAMRAAYAQAGWRPEDVDLVEGHGTGTPRGDAVELASLSEMWRGSKERAVLGSVKGNVGHLLTAAGIAGLVKVLSALRTATLPPSLATRPRVAADSRLRVLSSPEPWNRRAAEVPRRAAVSAFGFGGINAHLLVEELIDEAQGLASPRATHVREPLSIAIVGMATHVGRLDSLDRFERAALFGEAVDDAPSDARWHGVETRGPRMPELEKLRGAFLESLSLPLGRFKLPPNDLPKVLPQQLLALKVAGEALSDALPLGDGPHLRAGVVVGLGLDLETTSFHLRWHASHLVRTWSRERGLDLSAEETAAWVRDLRAAFGPELDATRTLGALGGIVPSRVAREFQLGGPSFAVMDEQASGLRAVEVAARMLERRDVDHMLACAVDLAGDIRAVMARASLKLFSPSGDARPFDREADGTKVGEGAVALVLRRLEDAEAKGERVYGVIRGIGAAGGGALDLTTAGGTERAYVRALQSAYAEAGTSTSRVGLIEAHGSGIPAEDGVEARALGKVFEERGRAASHAVASVAGLVGQAGAASSLISLARAALCLHRSVIPGGARVAAATPAIDREPFYLPRVPEAWLRDRALGERIAGVSSIGLDGTCMHAVLEGRTVRPLPLRRVGIFLVRGASQAKQLARLCEEGRLEIDALAVEWHHRSKGLASGGPIHAIVATHAEDVRSQLDRPRPELHPLGGALAIVFPGSGNHYVGMGRELALAMPDVYRALDEEVLHLESHLAPGAVVPRRASACVGWEDEARRQLTSKTERVIVAQVAHGIAVHDALRALGVKPDAFIGYSLGESAALFASRAWRDRDTMFRRTLSSPLFKSTLAGPMTLAREAWGPNKKWKVAILPRPASRVRAALEGTASLLIVNAPDECVIGGAAEDVDRAAELLECHAVVLEGVPSVHLPLVNKVRDEYYAHHALPTTPPAGTRFYSAAFGAAYEVTEASAAAATTENAVHGFDFPRLIEKAWEDGVRIFVEAGPQGSCTRMIRKILHGREHLAVSACAAGEDGYRTLLSAVATLAEAGVEVSLDSLYGASPRSVSPALAMPRGAAVVLGGALPPVPAPPARRRSPATPPAKTTRSAGVIGSRGTPAALASFFAAEEATAKAHETFLLVAQESLALQARLLAGGVARSPATAAPPQFDRASCLEFASGSIARVLGASFAEVDRFPTRVRLPEEPLMLVDRIVSVEGEAGSLGAGRVVTEHDVLENAWYLDGDRAPVCISVEAGQADLFLSAYLGIDRQTRGERVYRLLDAKIVFHRELPRSGERVRYDIRIDRFIRQGDTWLFFFRFDGSIDGRPFISMFDGCAGFFSAEQLESGRGIVPRAVAVRTTLADTKRIVPFRSLVPLGQTTLSPRQVEALRDGDLAAAFGSCFEGRTLAPALRLPRGRMQLVDRITMLDPAGGSERMGEVVGEADVEEDAWYLTCHFKDDEVMPGTLMYECCLHTLRVLLLGLGWVASEATDVHYGPVIGIPSELRCRGQVTQATKVVRYQVTILEIGYDPAPFVIARASMFADDKHVVQMEGMSLKLYGLTQEAIERQWTAPPVRRGEEAPRPALFDRDRIVAYAEGNPSECFGDAYKPFDQDRRLARLPRDPYLFVDRVTRVEQAPWVLEPGGWVTCEHDLSPDAWYFDAGGQGAMPFAVLLEVALQPCGWLAAYLGSALLSEVDLHFRNLDGHGVQLSEVVPARGLLTTRARLTKASHAGGMILQEFDIEILQGHARVYEGKTGFGFFPGAALAAQVGIRGAGEIRQAAGDRVDLRGVPSARRALALPRAMLLMVDDIVVEPRGGRRGLGRAVGTKVVDRGEWFFRAHFHQDPVMPGSLGLEALLTLLKQLALERFPEHRDTHRFQSMALGQPHRWQYRGQVVPDNGRVTVEAEVTRQEDGDAPVLVGDGHLAVDGRVIYSMHQFAVRLVPGARS
jgi:acyl transferase domain-containing protein/3-hydroxymyristoyl/3-hydroxydecanoyl-(acyl carrier protein) dehydratase